MVWVCQLLGGVSFRTERVSVNDYTELSSDPLLIQFVRGPAFFRLVNVYVSEPVVYAILVNYIPVIATSLQLTKSSKLLMVS